MPKNIVVLSDGTGQEGGRGHDTNIYKLFRMLEDRTPDQVVFYDQGLGTDWHKVTGNAFGVGFSKNILQCYKFIYDNYESGDRIFLLGFSRGAATVRSLASFISYFGILPKARPELIKRAWKLYRLGRQEMTKETRLELRGLNKAIHFVDQKALRRESLNDKADRFLREHPNHRAPIEFLGVFDTVPALGIVPLAGLNLFVNRIPWLTHQFHDFKLHKKVRNAYHALAIDDDRLWFHPTIWKECDEKQNVQQVWFSGSHTDVGGGFMAAGLSDVALEWMVDQAVSHGIRIYLNSRDRWNFVIAPDATDRDHQPRAGAGLIYKAAERKTVWDEKAFDSYGPPKLHRSVLERARRDPNYRPWILEVSREYASRLPEKFAEWVHEQYLKEYDELFHAYAQAKMQGTSTDLEPLPKSRAAWIEMNPEETWRLKNFQEYAEKLSEKSSAGEFATWLATYEPYTAWLSATYAAFEETEFGTQMVEPWSRIFEYTGPDGKIGFTSEDLDEAACAMRGYNNKKPLKLRDYDSVRLKDLLMNDQILFSEPGAHENLLLRVELPKPIVEPQAPVYKNLIAAIGGMVFGRLRKTAENTWCNRIEYDVNRWYPDLENKK